jgi:hypothetical protein
MASMVTTAPWTLSISDSPGMAVISLLLLPTKHWARVMPPEQAQALTPGMWLSPPWRLPRSALPSMAICSSVRMKSRRRGL